MDESFVLLSRFKPRAGQEAALFDELSYVAQQSRQEAGNQLYIMHRSLDDHATILLYVIWANRAALEFHQQTDHFKQFMAKSDALLVEPIDVSLWNEVSR